ncbi:MAG: hemin ABC transporter substrate-binding protein [Rubricoccaceae bacterium]
MPLADASRLVVLGGPIAETVFALGAGEFVVAADRSASFPDAARAVATLDYFRQTSAEGVLAARPTAVLAIEGTGPPGVLTQLRAAGVAVEMLPEALTPEAAEARVRRVAALLGREAAAEPVIARMRADLAAVRRPGRPVRALFVYTRGAGLVLVAGMGTSADAVLRLAGAENAATSFEGFRPLTAEAVAVAEPEVVVVPARGLESLGGIDGLLAQPGLAQTPAGQARRVVAVDDALLLGFGPRLGQGVAALADGLRAAPAQAAPAQMAPAQMAPAQTAPARTPAPRRS